MAQQFMVKLLRDRINEILELTDTSVARRVISPKTVAYDLISQQSKVFFSCIKKDEAIYSIYSIKVDGITAVEVPYSENADFRKHSFEYVVKCKTKEGIEIYSIYQVLKERYHAERERARQARINKAKLEEIEEQKHAYDFLGQILGKQNQY